jgi:cell division septum initiation protein DivIVA
MGRGRNSKKVEDEIGQLNRENKDLKQKIENLKKQLHDLQKADTTKVEKFKQVKPLEKACPDCASAIKETEIANVGVLELCAKACGYRNMRKKK